MVVVDEVKEHRAKREGKVTPRALADNLVRLIEDGEVESVVVVTRRTDRTITTCWSQGEALVALGLLEAGKNDILLEMME